MVNNPSITLHRENWHDNLVEVIENGDYRSLYFSSSLLQSRMSTHCPEQLQLSYTRYMLLHLPATSDPKNILIIGIGAGSLVHFCHHHFPRCRIDAVDSSSRVIDLARGYFQLPENRQVRVHCREGHAFLQEVANERGYDLILVDAFDHTGMSETIYQEPFFELCRTALEKDGILSCNLWSGDSQRLQTIQEILQHFFPGYLQIPVPERGNIVVLAGPELFPWQHFNRSREEWRLVEERFDLDFRNMLTIARRHNQSTLQRLSAFIRQLTLH